MNQCENGRHSCGFFRWLIAAEYDGKYRCKCCGCEEKIPDTVRKKNQYGFLIILLFWAPASFLGVELGKLWIGLAGLILGVAVLLIRMRMLWKESCGSESEHT